MKKLQELHVSMLPNGYDVKIGKKSMLYFNEQELLEGLFVHIGLKIDDYMNKQTIRDLMTACATYPKENTLANVCQTMKRKGGRDKADAAIIAQMEEAARKMGQIK